jgi:hypothetical protein
LLRTRGAALLSTSELGDTKVSYCQSAIAIEPLPDEFDGRNCFMSRVGAALEVDGRPSPSNPNWLVAALSYCCLWVCVVALDGGHRSLCASVRGVASSSRHCSRPRSRWKPVICRGRSNDVPQLVLLYWYRSPITWNPSSYSAASNLSLSLLSRPCFGLRFFGRDTEASIGSVRLGPAPVWFVSHGVARQVSGQSTSLRRSQRSSTTGS